MFDDFPGLNLLLPTLGVGQALEPPPMMALVSKGNPEETWQMWSTLTAILVKLVLLVYVYKYMITY